MPVVWSDKPSKVWAQGMDNYRRALVHALADLADAVAVKAANWMKDNRPWKDRTFNARASLGVIVYAQKTGVLMVFTMGRLPNGAELEYAKYLEYSHGGRYAIIGPAIDHWGPIVMDAARRVMTP